MSATLPLELPAPPDTDAVPEWTGHGFRLKDKLVPVLAYHVSDSGWSEGLTEFHEGAAGESHFIDVLSRTHAINELQRALPRQDGVLMDIGCSSGFLIRDMRKAFPRASVLGSDYIVGPLSRLASQEPDIPLVQFDLTDCPLPDASLDGITLLNVLEHIEDDALAARQLYRVLKPGGVLVLEVPSNPSLYDYYDQELMHHRRYTMPALTRVLESAGFKVQRRRHLGVSLYPMFWLVKKWHRMRPPGGKSSQASVETDISKTRSMGPLIRPVLAIERLLLKALYVPFGIRCDVTAVRPR